MKMMKGFLLSAACLGAALLPAAGHAQPEAAKQSVQSFLEEIRGMDFPIADPAKHEAAVKRADAFLDLEAMGKKALAEHGDQATEEERRKFMDLLWKLIENIAYPRSRSFLGTTPIEYGEPKTLEKGVEIPTTVKDPEGGLDTPVVYDLAEAGGGWKIYDIFLDGVTITEDLKFQFDKIIRDSSFAGLLERMQERLAKAEAENAKK